MERRGDVSTDGNRGFFSIVVVVGGMGEPRIGSVQAPRNTIGRGGNTSRERGGQAAHCMGRGGTRSRTRSRSVSGGTADLGIRSFPSPCLPCLLPLPFLLSLPRWCLPRSVPSLEAKAVDVRARAITVEARQSAPNRNGVFLQIRSYLPYLCPVHIINPLLRPPSHNSPFTLTSPRLSDPVSRFLHTDLPLIQPGFMSSADQNNKGREK
jgi:hypothetical protein